MKFGKEYLYRLHYLGMTRACFIASCGLRYQLWPLHKNTAQCGTVPCGLGELLCMLKFIFAQPSSRNSDAVCLQKGHYSVRYNIKRLDFKLQHHTARLFTVHLSAAQTTSHPFSLWHSQLLCQSLVSAPSLCQHSGLIEMNEEGDFYDVLVLISNMVGPWPSEKHKEQEEMKEISHSYKVNFRSEDFYWVREDKFALEDKWSRQRFFTPVQLRTSQLTYSILFSNIQSKNAPLTELNQEGEITARKGTEVERACIFSGSQTDAPSPSRWNSSLTPQQQWPVMCGFHCDKTVKFVRSPHVKSGRSAHEIWRPFSARVTELDVLLLLYICWTFHSHTPNPRGDQVSTQNPSFINTQVDLTYSTARGRGCIHESLT